MKKPLLVLVFGFILVSRPGLAVSAPALADSIGVEKKDGKVYVLHRIGQGQTLYSLVRRYNTSIQAIKDANPGLGDNVQYDQTVRVPVTLARKEEKKVEKAIKKEEKAKRKEEREVAKAPVGPRSVENPNSGIHQVEVGQTVYSLAAKYGISTSDLRKWNGLTNDHIESGQALIVTERAWREREPSVSNKPMTRAPETAKTTTKPSDSPKTERPSPPRTVARNEVPRTEPAKSEPAREESSRSAESAPTASEVPRTEVPRTEVPRVIRPGDTNPLPNPGSSARRVAEIGFAEVIDESDNSNKYLALHRTAPVGTLVLVRNDRNNQSIWVKVIGRLPDTSVNDKVVVKISARAFEKLSPADRRFRAEVSYLAQ